MWVLNPDLINSCRVCRSPNQDGDYQCLFEATSEHEEGNSVLSESGVLYEKLLDISLNERNYYPKFLCNSCHLQMKLFMKLRDKALKTLQYLREIYDEVVVTTTPPIGKETTNFNYQTNEQNFSPNEPQDCQDILDEYRLNGYEDYQDNIVEEFEKTPADDTVYNYPAIDEENELVKLASNNSYNEFHLDQNRLYTEQQIANSVVADIETEVTREQTDTLEQKFLTDIEPDEKITEPSNSQEHFSHLKLEPILDKNDYITEIYELIDDECEVEEKYTENQETMEDADYNSFSETVAETGSTYNDIEYLLEEDTDDLEDEADLEEITNAGKRKRLNKECKNSKTYKCLECQLEFKNLQMFKLHRIESHNESFTCSDCSKEFKSITALQKHIKSRHNREPAFQCNICKKTFNQKVHFQYHMNHHNNIRNYKCEVCEKAFIGKADLKTHQRLHSGERPYVCNVCGKDYLMMEHLKAHFITHTEQSFPCEVCNKNFTTPKTLRLHVRTIHEDEPRFKCTFCSKPFRRKHHLEYHLKSHEKNLKILDPGSETINESYNLEDIVEEAIDDPGFIFLV